jgi:hypothetical protein
MDAAPTGTGNPLARHDLQQIEQEELEGRRKRHCKCRALIVGASYGCFAGGGSERFLSLG